MTILRLINQAIHASILAGSKIREVYSQTNFEVQLKNDQTPVTRADQNAHDEIMRVLASWQLPVLSEEGTTTGFQERKNWDLFWMVDPLDGTKEFIKRNDEFTVNIALINKNTSVAGVIYAPITGELYAGIPGSGAYKLINPTANCSFQFMQQSGTKLPEKTDRKHFTIAVSRSHMNQETEAYVEALRKKHQSVQVINLGSSLKMCRIAEGMADVYPKFGKTMEWDTAAAHAIVKAAGKNIYCTDLKTELIYNKEELQNPHFIVL